MHRVYCSTHTTSNKITSSEMTRYVLVPPLFRGHSSSKHRQNSSEKLFVTIQDPNCDCCHERENNKQTVSRNIPSDRHLPQLSPSSRPATSTNCRRRSSRSKRPAPATSSRASEESTVTRRSWTTRQRPLRRPATRQRLLPVTPRKYQHTRAPYFKNAARTIIQNIIFIGFFKVTAGEQDGDRGARPSVVCVRGYVD